MLLLTPLETGVGQMLVRLVVVVVVLVLVLQWRLRLLLLLLLLMLRLLMLCVMVQMGGGALLVGAWWMRLKAWAEMLVMRVSLGYVKDYHLQRHHGCPSLKGRGEQR